MAPISKSNKPIFSLLLSYDNFYLDLYSSYLIQFRLKKKKLVVSNQTYYSQIRQKVIIRIGVSVIQIKTLCFFFF